MSLGRLSVGPCKLKSDWMKRLTSRPYGSVGRTNLSLAIIAMRLLVVAITKVDGENAIE